MSLPSRGVMLNLMDRMKTVNYEITGNRWKDEDEDLEGMSPFDAQKYLLAKKLGLIRERILQRDDALKTKKGGECVRVVVRVRPFNDREKALNCKSCVEVRNDSICLLKASDVNSSQHHDRHFTFDHVFDQEVSQEKVFEHAARPILDSVMEGYNGTIFAYGQTGSGKTWTMEGPPDVPELRGLTWRSLAYIFSGIENSSDGTTYLVRVSMLEIYKEQIRDLVPKKADAGKSLDLREDKKRGIYVQNLNSYVVANLNDVKNIMKAGNKNRAVGATDMNKRSSRSHLIMTVAVESSQKSELDGKTHVKVGKLNLVDLAGSERIKKTKATSERIEEGIDINLSLTALGNVISALSSTKNQQHIPYRTSKLTRLLQDSLGGNTKTVMVANISPADDNYEETTSTIRYAERAKKIVNAPVVNQDPKDAMLSNLLEQIKSLEMKLQEQQGSQSGSQGGASTLEKSVDEEQLKQLIEQNESEKQKLLESMKNQSEEEKNKLLEQQNRLQEDRKKLEDELKSRHDQLEVERKEREALVDKLQRMQKNVMRGKQKLLAENKEQAEKLRKQNELLQHQKQEQLRLKQEMEEHIEERIALEEKYSSIQEEATVKTKKLKKLFAMYQTIQADYEDVQLEFQQEREDYLNTIRNMEKEMKLMFKIIDYFIPYEEVEKIKSRASWDETEDDYIIESALLAGNVIRPETTFADSNILDLELDMPERTTEDFLSYYDESDSSYVDNQSSSYQVTPSERSSSRASSAKRINSAKQKRS